MTVEDVERALGAAEHGAALRQITGLWKQLQTLRGQAKRDAAKLPAYRDLLSRSIERAKQDAARDAVLEGQELIEACDAIWAHYRAEYERLKIGSHERMRVPEPWEQWIEHFLPNSFQAFCACLNRWTEKPTQGAHAQLLLTITKSMEQYLEGPNSARLLPASSTPTTSAIVVDPTQRLSTTASMWSEPLAGA